MIRDTRMKARAITQRWQMSHEQRQSVIEDLLAVMRNPLSNPREKIAAAKALISAEGQNQSDEHKVLDVQLQLDHDRLSAIASELGIDPALVVDAASKTGAGTDGTFEAEEHDDA